MPLKSLKIDNFQLGQIDSVDDKGIPRGSSSRALNWFSGPNGYSLRRGYRLFGENSGAGKITGQYVAKKANGDEVKFRTRGAKLETYNSSTEVWDEVGSDVLGTAGTGKDISFAEYHSLAGDQLFINSPYGPFLKIMLANPTSYADMYNSAKNYYGYIEIKNNRIFLWGRTADRTGVYMSYIDARNSTTVTGESISGSGNTRTGTLAFKGGGTKRTCFAVTFADAGSGETFSDNGDGTLTGSAGGTGTINYMSGEYSVTFINASGAITSTYQWEDSTNQGLADFTYSGTRTAGQGLILRQDDGGNLQNIEFYEDNIYCLHTKKTWVINLTSDDTSATNIIYRENVGIDSWRGSISTGDGVYYVDTSDQADPQLRLLTIPYGTTKVMPISVSKSRVYNKVIVGLDLSNFIFDKTSFEEYKDYIVFSCRTSDSTENNRTIFFNKKHRSFDITDLWASVITKSDDGLLIGDAGEANTFLVLTGYDDNEFNIDNYAELNLDDLNFEGQKKLKKLIISGTIGTDQAIEVYASVDNGSDVLLGTISGSNNNVLSGTAVVGRTTIGTKEIGGGGSGEEFADFLATINVNLDKFNRIKLSFTATRLGEATISYILYYDIRYKNLKIKA